MLGYVEAIHAEPAILWNRVEAEAGPVLLCQALSTTRLPTSWSRARSTFECTPRGKRVHACAVLLFQMPVIPSVLTTHLHARRGPMQARARGMPCVSLCLQIPRLPLDERVLLLVHATCLSSSRADQPHSPSQLKLLRELLLGSVTADLSSSSVSPREAAKVLHSLIVLRVSLYPLCFRGHGGLLVPLHLDLLCPSRATCIPLSVLPPPPPPVCPLLFPSPLPGLALSALPLSSSPPQKHREACSTKRADLPTEIMEEDKRADREESSSSASAFSNDPQCRGHSSAGSLSSPLRFSCYGSLSAPRGESTSACDPLFQPGQFATLLEVLRKQLVLLPSSSFIPLLQSSSLSSCSSASSETAQGQHPSHRSSQTAPSDLYREAATHQQLGGVSDSKASDRGREAVEITRRWEGSEGPQEKLDEGSFPEASYDAEFLASVSSLVRSLAVHSSSSAATCSSLLRWHLSLPATRLSASTPASRYALRSASSNVPATIGLLPHGHIGVDEDRSSAAPGKYSYLKDSRSFSPRVSSPPSESPPCTPPSSPYFNTSLLPSDYHHISIPVTLVLSLQRCIGGRLRLLYRYLQDTTEEGSACQEAEGKDRADVDEGGHGCSSGTSGALHQTSTALHRSVAAEHFDGLDKLRATPASGLPAALTFARLLSLFSVSLVTQLPPALPCDQIIHALHAQAAAVHFAVAFQHAGVGAGVCPEGQDEATSSSSGPFLGESRPSVPGSGAKEGKADAAGYSSSATLETGSRPINENLTAWAKEIQDCLIVQLHALSFLLRQISGTFVRASCNASGGGAEGGVLEESSRSDNTIRREGQRSPPSELATPTVEDAPEEMQDEGEGAQVSRSGRPSRTTERGLDSSSPAPAPTSPGTSSAEGRAAPSLSTERKMVSKSDHANPVPCPGTLLKKAFADATVEALVRHGLASIVASVNRVNEVLAALWSVEERRKRHRHPCPRWGSERACDGWMPRQRAVVEFSEEAAKCLTQMRVLLVEGCSEFAEAATVGLLFLLLLRYCFLGRSTSGMPSLLLLFAVSKTLPAFRPAIPCLLRGQRLDATALGLQM